MRKQSLVLLALIALLANAAPAFAACVKASDGPIGPPIASQQMLYNNYFDDTSCNVWSGTTYVTLQTNGSDKYYEIDGSFSGSLHQNADETLPYDQVNAKWELEVLNRAAAGTERLEVEMVDLGTGAVVEVFATQYASTVSDGVYNVATSNASHAGRSVRFRFRVVAGNAPGDSIFRIKRALLWSIWP